MHAIALAACFAALSGACATRPRIPEGTYVSPSGTEWVRSVDDELHFDLRARSGAPKVDPERGYEYFITVDEDGDMRPGRVIVVNAPPSSDPIHSAAAFYWDGSSFIREDPDTGERTAFAPTAPPR